MAIDDGDPNDTLRKLVDTVTHLRRAIEKIDATTRRNEKPGVIISIIQMQCEDALTKERISNAD